MPPGPQVLRSAACLRPTLMWESGVAQPPGPSLVSPEPSTCPAPKPSLNLQTLCACKGGGGLHFLPSKVILQGELQASPVLGAPGAVSELSMSGCT